MICCHETGNHTRQAITGCCMQKIQHLKLSRSRFTRENTAWFVSRIIVPPARCATFLIRISVKLGSRQCAKVVQARIALPLTGAHRGLGALRNAGQQKSSRTYIASSFQAVCQVAQWRYKGSTRVCVSDVRQHPP